MGPGIVGFLLTIITMFLTSASLVREKEQQTLDTLLMSPLSTLEIYVGKALPAAMIGLVDMVIGLLVVVLWFDIPFRGSLFYLFLAALVYLAAILSYALLISVLSATTQQAMFFAWFSLMIFLLMSGFFTPVENIPPAAAPRGRRQPLALPDQDHPRDLPQGQRHRLFLERPAGPGRHRLDPGLGLAAEFQALHRQVRKVEFFPIKQTR